MRQLRLQGPGDVRIIQVIRVQFARGSGTADDPIRPVAAYYDFDGNLLAENDTEPGATDSQDAPR